MSVLVFFPSSPSRCAQRGLLRGQLTQPRLFGQVMAYPAVRSTAAGTWRVHMATLTRRLAASNASRPQEGYPRGGLAGMGGRGAFLPPTGQVGKRARSGTDGTLVLPQRHR